VSYSWGGVAWLTRDVRHKMSLTTKSGIKAIAIIAVVVCTGLFVCYEFSPGGIQRRNLQRAEKHIARFAGEFTSHPRFQKVSFAAGFMADGCIKVSGEVCDEADLVDLRRLWEETSPPVATSYFVTPVGARKEEPNKRPERNAGATPVSTSMPSAGVAHP